MYVATCVVRNRRLREREGERATQRDGEGENTTPSTPPWTGLITSAILYRATVAVTGVLAHSLRSTLVQVG